MLVVYQSMESTGTKAKGWQTVFTGNSFKQKVHSHLHEVPKLLADISQKKVRRYGEDTYTTAGSALATAQQSTALSVDLKNSGDVPKQLLEKIIERIVDNAAACTAPGTERKYVRRPDVIVLGECAVQAGVDINGYVVLSSIDPTGDARHRFTLMVQSGPPGMPSQRYAGQIQATSAIDSDSKAKNENAVCMMAKLRGWLFAFVHTPNEICSSPDRAAKYLLNNVGRCGAGAELDVVIGDTNQSSNSTVQNYMNNSFNALSGGNDVWHTSLTNANKQVVRGDTNYVVSGTNSTYSTHFDIACTRQVHFKLNRVHVRAESDMDELTYTASGSQADPVFMLHGLTDKFIEWEGLRYAYSDHNGVILEILRDKPEHAERIESNRRAQIKNNSLARQSRRYRPY